MPLCPVRGDNHSEVCLSCSWLYFSFLSVYFSTLCLYVCALCNVIVSYRCVVVPLCVGCVLELFRLVEDTNAVQAASALLSHLQQSTGAGAGSGAGAGVGAGADVDDLSS